MRDCASLWGAYDEITQPYSDIERDRMFFVTACRLYRI